ncbi:DUF1641 domain-containing protein [Metabacillus herbersteinensis]|uniref:DUF1641 domain-containing protein n=1 Tax=Metabacillus herbersteinensis TaxID=283816 RepID=A0ABV6GBN1_9BACI
MAKAIRHIEKKTMSPEEEQTESLSEILSLIAKNKETIKNTLDIMNELQNAGVLDIMNGLLKTREKVGVIAVQQMNQLTMHNTIKNGIQTAQLLGELDPVKLNTLLKAANRGLEQASESTERVSKWGLLKSMNDPSVLSSLSVMVGFLQGMGKELNEQKH